MKRKADARKAWDCRAFGGGIQAKRKAGASAAGENHAKGGGILAGGNTPGKEGGSRGRIRVILVEPQYGMNVGMAARAMKNFGFSDLCIVSPKCDVCGFDAKKYSKHALDVLQGARVCKTLREAARGCKFVAGTTGVLYRHWGETFRTPISLRQFAAKLKRQKEGRLALAFGNEGVGLSERHISECDLLITIPASEKYPILNLSHAVAVCLYELSGINIAAYAPAGEKEKKHLVKSFALLVDRFSHELRNPKKVKIAFCRMAGRALLSDKECAALLGILRRANRGLEKRAQSNGGL